METTMQNETKKWSNRWEKTISHFTEIPKNRKTATPENLRWFLRNGAILVRDRIETEDAVYCAQKALDD